MKYRTKAKLRKLLKIVTFVLVVAALLRFVPEFIPEGVRQEIESAVEGGKKVISGTRNDGVKALEALYNEYMANSDGNRSEGSTDRLQVVADTVPAGI